MDDINQSTRNLIHSIENSKQYREFLEARAQLGDQEEKLKLVDEFRMRNYELRSSEVENGNPEELEKFSYEVEHIRRDHQVDAYLSAEQHMCKIIREIFKEIVDEVDLNLDFLE